MSETIEGIGGRKWSLLRQSPEQLEASRIAAAIASKRSQSYASSEDAIRDGGPVCVMQGATTLCQLTPDGEPLAELLVTAPQLWDAANAVVRQYRKSIDERPADTEAAVERLANMVAKAVGKMDWKDVAQ